MGGGRSRPAELGRIPRLYGLFRLPAGRLDRGVAWALVIIHGSALAPQVQILSYMMTGVVAFLMCIQARRTLLSFVPGTFIGACATFAADGDWRLVIPSLALGLVFGYAMKNSGLWLAARADKHKLFVNDNA